MCHIAHMRKQNDEINKHIRLYHNVDLERKKNIIYYLGKIGSSFVQTGIPFTEGCFVPNLIEIGPVVLDKKILKFR